MGDFIQFPISLHGAPELASATAQGFSAARHLAALGDQILPKPRLAETVLRGGTWSEAIATLAPDQRENLQEVFGVGALRELQALASEQDPELFFSGLMSLAGRLEQEAKTEAVAHLLYRQIESSSGLAGQIGLAKERRLALEGKGDFGARSEYFLRRFAGQAGDYRTLLALFGGAMVGSGFYNIVRHKVGLSITQSLIARGIGPASYEAAMMRIKSRVVGWAVGSLSAALAERGLRQAMGQPVFWDAASLSRDTVMASFHLFAWRSSIALSDTYTVRAMSLVTPKNLLWKKIEVFAFQQTLSAVSLGAAMLANQKIFGQVPETGTAALGQIASLLLGMSFGRLAGRKVVQASH